MKAVGKVIETSGNTAKVMSVRSSACASCEGCEAKGACHVEIVFGNQTEQVVIDAENRVGAKKGDTVELESSTSKTLFVSAMLFVVPIVVAFVLYLIADSVLTPGPAAAVFLLSFAACFGLLGVVMNRFVKKNVTTYIVKVTEESEF